MITETIARNVMWLLAAVTMLKGMGLLVWPGYMRAIAGALRSNGPVRVVGVAMMVAGAALFARGDMTGLPLFVKTMGVVLFVSGGVGALLPALAIIINEHVMELRDRPLRLAFIVPVCVAYLFYLAASRPGTPIANGG